MDTVAHITGTTQMIYDIQVLKPGSVLWGEVTLTPSATAAHARVLGAALALWAPGGVAHLAAKNSVGYGQVTIPLEDTTGDLEWWTEHLASHRDEILALISEISG